MISGIIAFICAVAVIAVDQISKHYIVANFAAEESHQFIGGLINIVYVENMGAAWGIFQGRTWLLLVITAVVMAICVVMLIKSGLKNKLLLWSMCLVLSGGIGNMIDRVFNNGVVVDFLQFDFWQSFPVFNIADCAIVIGGGMLLLNFLIETVNEFKHGKKLKSEAQQKNDG